MDATNQAGGGLKTCPRCGAKLFADMDVCYGCLYDFARGGEPAVGAVADASLLELSRELEEPTLVPSAEVPGALGATTMTQARPVPQPQMSSQIQAPPQSPSVSQGSAAFQPQAACLTSPAPEAERPEPVAALMSPSCVRVSCGDMTVPMEVGKEGLVLGREPGCDVVIDHPEVAARHLVLLFRDGVLFAQNLGTANPVLVNGWVLAGLCPLRCGDVVEVRPAGVTIRPWPAAGGRSEAA